MESSASASSKQVSSSDLNPTELIENYQRGLWRYLRALGCDSALADDLTQDTFVKVLQKPFNHYDDAATAAYLRRIAHNLYISIQRRAGKVVAVENLQKFEDVWCQWIADDQGNDYLDALAICFDKLNPRAKWALEMRFRDKLARSKIAEQLQITENGAKNLMQRAKQRLRECVERKIESHE